MLAQNSDAFRNCFRLHAGSGLLTFLPVWVGSAMRAFSEEECFPLLDEVVCDINYLYGLAVDCENLPDVVLGRVAAIGHDPSFCSKVSC